MPEIERCQLSGRDNAKRQSERGRLGAGSGSCLRMTLVKYQEATNSLQLMITV